MTTGKALSALHDQGLAPGAVELLCPLPESLDRRQSPRVWPAAVSKVRPGAAHRQLDDVRDDAIEGHSEAHHETRDCEVGCVLGHHKADYDGRQWDERDEGPQ